MSQLRAQRQLAPDRARVDLRRRAGHRARPAGGRVPRRAGRDRAAPRACASWRWAPRSPRSSRVFALLRVALAGRRCATRSTARSGGPAARAARRSSPSRRCSTVCLFPGPLLAGRERPAVRHRARDAGQHRQRDARRGAGVLALALVGARRRRGARGPAAAPRIREWIGRRGFLAVLYARIAPGVPYSLVNYAAGLTPVALRRLRRGDRDRRARRGRSPTRRSAAASTTSRRRRRSSRSSCSWSMAVGGLLLARRDAAHRATSASP